MNVTEVCDQLFMSQKSHETAGGNDDRSSEGWEKEDAAGRCFPLGLLRKTVLKYHTQRDTLNMDMSFVTAHEPARERVC